MINRTREDIVKLINSILDKYGWDQQTLGLKIKTKPEVISRWKTGVNVISQRKLDLLNDVLRNGVVLSQNVQETSTSITYPFSIKIPKESIKMSVDKDGNIDLFGIMSIKLSKAG